MVNIDTLKNHDGINSWSLMESGLFKHAHAESSASAPLSFFGTDIDPAHVTPARLGGGRNDSLACGAAASRLSPQPRQLSAVRRQPSAVSRQSSQPSAVSTVCRQPSQPSAVSCRPSAVSRQPRQLTAVSCQPRQSSDSSGVSSPSSNVSSSSSSP